MKQKCNFLFLIANWITILIILRHTNLENDYLMSENLTMASLFKYPLRMHCTPLSIEDSVSPLF